MECLLDEIAHKLNLDPIELKRRQLVLFDSNQNDYNTILVGREHPNDTTLIGSEHHFHLIGSYGLDRALEKVKQALGYQPGIPPVVAGHLRRGIGFAVAMEGSGLAKIHLAKVRMALKPDGRYEMRTGAVDLGTGSETTLRQIAAEVLSTTVDQIDIITADTHYTPFDAGAYASATLYISGQAANLAATQLRSRLLEVAGRICCAPLAELALIGNTIRSNTQVIDLQTLVQKAEATDAALEVEQEYAADRSSVTFAVQGVEVEVDTKTGRITVLRCVQAVDIGKAINPRICYGQVRGAMVMGLGYALCEELWFDDHGQILNPTPRTYRLPVAKDVPPMDVILVEESDPYGPFGAKAIGEVGVNCMAPGIANAVAHTTGVRLRQLPMTPERVWQALQEIADDKCPCQ
jgi:CO/xanthine dehydrogenase Mo-binding subunit